MMIAALLFTGACAKKSVMSEPGLTQEAPDAAAAREAAQKAEAEELARQRRLEEERLKEERTRQETGEAAQREMMADRDLFVNEDVYFDFDSSVLLPAAQEVLRNKAEWLRKYPQASVMIEGHCDERGTGEYNIALGDRRAESAKAFLIDLGVRPSRLTTVSFGEERPLDPGHDEAAWARNRRAHFVLRQ
jgi:peptidoglycan-associated lipoprotein